MKVIGTITRVSSGTIEKGKNAGQEWQQLTVEGIRLFVPADLQNGYQRGQRVRMDIIHRGDKKLVAANGDTIGYEAEFDLLTCEILQEVIIKE